MVKVVHKPAQEKFWENNVIDESKKGSMDEVMARLDAIEAKIDELLEKKKEEDDGWVTNR